MDHSRTLAPTPFPGDDGQPDESVRAALAEAVTGPQPEAYLRAIAALGVARLLVPVVATATRLAETEVENSAEQISTVLSDKEAEMAVVLLQAADGRRAMLAFTGLDALQAWDARARPVPVTVDLVAKTAQAEKVDAVLVDVAGPVPLAFDGEVLEALAAGHRLVETTPGEFGWAIPTDGAESAPSR